MGAEAGEVPFARVTRSVNNERVCLIIGLMSRTTDTTAAAEIGLMNPVAAAIR